MNRNNRKLIRQLENLQTKIDRIKQTYLSQTRNVSGAIPTPRPETKPANTPPPAENEIKNRLLMETALKAGKESEIYKAVNEKINSLLQSGQENFSISHLKEIRQIMENIRQKTDNWEIFRQKFLSVYPEFFEKLKAAHPDLTKTETRFCAYLRTHMSSQQIAAAMDISMEAIRKYRYRIRKRLELETGQSLEETIDTF